MAFVLSIDGVQRVGVAHQNKVLSSFTYPFFGHRKFVNRFWSPTANCRNKDTNVGVSLKTPEYTKVAFVVLCNYALAIILMLRTSLARAKFNRMRMRQSLQLFLVLARRIIATITRDYLSAPVVLN